jgi:hypothetical protein
MPIVAFQLPQQISNEEKKISGPATSELQAETSRATTPGKVVNGAFGLKRCKR